MDTEDIIQNKTLVQKAISFITTEGLWLFHGKPYRSIEDINNLYYNVCSKCEFFENEGCKICGCRLVPNERSPLNKLSMATTNCPLPTNPKWISEIAPPNNMDANTVQAILESVKFRETEYSNSAESQGHTMLSEETRAAVEEVKKKEAGAVDNPFTRLAR